MKKILLGMLLVSGTVFSQEWAEIGATWHYNYQSQNFGVFNIDGEQMINGQMCRHINRTTNFNGWGSGQYEYTYYSNDTVYFWDPDSSVFRILYDFGADPGDSWVYSFVGQNWQHPGDRDSIITVVDSVDFVTINSYSLRRLYIHYEASYFEDTTNFCNPLFVSWSGAPTNSEIIEYIGDINFMFNTYTYDFEESECFSPHGLRCFEDTTIGFYETGIVDSCDWMSDVGIEEVKKFIKIYPNPANHKLHFEFENTIPRRIYIKDIQGRLVETYKPAINQQTLEVDVSTFEAGVYFCVFEGNDSFFSEKVIIER